MTHETETKQTVRDLLGHPLPIAQKGNKVLAVAPQQVIRHLLANENLGSLDDFADRQGCVVVVILVVDPVRVASHHLFQQLHAHHCFPAEDRLHTGHGSCLTLIYRRREEVYCKNIKTNIFRLYTQRICADT